MQTQITSETASETPEVSKTRFDKFTCKVYNLGERKTPKKITLLGNKSKPESAQHVIEFPGGAVEVSRTSDGNYWAHIIVNRGWSDGDCDGFRNSIGEIVDSRIDSNEITEIPHQDQVQQIAVLIKPLKA